MIYFNLGGCDEPNNVAEFKLHASSFPLKAVCVRVCVCVCVCVCVQQQLDQ